MRYSYAVAVFACGVAVLTGCANSTNTTSPSSPNSSATTRQTSAAPTSPATSPRSSATTLVAEDLNVPAAAAELQWPPAGVPEGSTGGCDRPTWPKASSIKAAGNGSRVLVIGDSLTREVALFSEEQTPTSPRIRAALTKDGWTPTVVCWKGKTTEWASAEVAELARLNLIPPRVVVATGTNDLWVDNASAETFTTRATTLLTALAATTTSSGAPPQVWWVNLWIDTAMAAWNHAREPRDPDMAGYQAYNTALKSVCTPQLNCHIVDWHAAVDSDPALAKRIAEPDLDGVHMTMDGASARATVIARVLANATK